MNLLLNYIIESLFCGAISYLLFRVVFSKVNNYSFQRVTLIILFLVSLIFPFVNIPVSNSVIAGFVIDPLYVTPVGDVALENVVNRNWIISISMCGYFFITVFLLVKLYFEFFKIYKIRKNSKLFKAENRYNIFFSKLVDSPFSFGRSLYIPDLYKDEYRKMAIVHEVSHITRQHTIDILFVNIVLSFVWFNPFLYSLKKRLIEVHEFQADMDVISSGFNINKYKELLFLSQFSLVPNISNSLHKSLTFKRFFKMKNLKQTNPGTKVITFFAVAILLLFSVTSFSKATILPSSNNGITSELVSPGNGSVDAVELSQSNDTTSSSIPFVMVEFRPVFQGGDENNFTNWVAQQLVYPEKAVKDSIQGRVILQFTVDKSGKVGDVKVVRGVHPVLDKEAIRVVSLSPNWEPGKHKGKNVNVVYTFPVIFQLDSKK